MAMLIIVALIAAAAAGLASGVYFISIGALLVLALFGGWMLVTRGMHEQLERRAGTDKIPSSAEASVNPVVDPSQPTGGTTGNAAPDSESAGRN